MKVWQIKSVKNSVHGTSVEMQPVFIPDNWNEEEIFDNNESNYHSEEISEKTFCRKRN